MALLILQQKKMTGNRVRERGSDTQQMVPRPGVELGSTAGRTKPLYMGCCSANWSKRRPPVSSFDSLMSQWTAEHWSMCLITFKSIRSDRKWLFVTSCTDWRLLGNCPTYGSAPHWCWAVLCTILRRRSSSPPPVDSWQPKGRKPLPVQVQHEESQSVSVGRRQLWDGPIHDSSAVVFISQLWHTHIHQYE